MKSIYRLTPVPNAPADAGRRRACRSLLGLPAAQALARWPAGGPAAAAIVTLAGCGTPPAAPPAPAAPGQVVPFSQAPADGWLPAGWAPYVARRDRALTEYATVARDGATVVQATARRSSSGLRCPVDIDAQARPWLHWRWRADEVPPGRSVADDERDDAIARVGLAFDGDVSTLPQRERLFFERVELFTGQRLPYATLMYVWDAELPVGTVVPYPRSRRIQYLVVASGSSGAGRWQTQDRNVVDDYRRIFGETPGRITSVGVLTDSDDLGGVLRAWYGDIRLDDSAPA